MVPCYMPVTATRTHSKKPVEAMTPAILPYPTSLKTGEGSCQLHPLRVQHSDPELGSVASYLDEVLAPGGTGAAATAITLTVNPDIGNAEGYRLEIGEGQIQIQARSAAGAFYGAQSLLQLQASSASTPNLRIDDAPAYAWRGMHLDCSRHFFDVNFIKRYIDLLAQHKMNRFHWHLCDDQGWRLESRRFPLLTHVGAWRERSVIGHTANRQRQYETERYGGYYSQEQVREVVAYAADRHIQVLPEIDIPGHAAALLAAYPELSCDGGQYRVEEHYGIFPDVLCPSERTFDFLAELFAEIAELFPFEYVHIGGDEVIKDHWQACPHCQQLMREQDMASVDQLHGYFVARVETILAGLGRRAIGWDEVMDGDIDSRTTIMCWTGFDACRKALEAGHDAIMTPVECTYFDFYQSTSLDEPQAIHGLATLKQVFDYDPLPAGVAEALRPHVLGAQANVWTEYLCDEDAVEYACLPRMSALAEVTWTGAGRDWDSFCRRLPVIISELEARGHRVARSVFKPCLQVSHADNNTLRVHMSCEMPGMHIHYTTDGSAPTSSSPRYDSPITISSNSIIRCCTVHPVTGEAFGDERQHLAIHRGLNRPLYRVEEGNLLRAPELASLSNGRLGLERIFHAFEWCQFSGPEADIAVDLGAAITVNTVKLNFEAGAHRQLFFPSSVELLVSEDGLQWRSAALRAAAELGDGRLELQVHRDRVRYVRLRIENHDKHYGPEQRRDITRPVHLDELVIN